MAVLQILSFLNINPCRTEDSMPIRETVSVNSVSVQTQSVSSTTASPERTALTLSVQPVTADPVPSDPLCYDIDRNTLQDAQKKDPILKTVSEWVLRVSQTCHCGFHLVS